ncbi:HlyD family secretion protein [Brevibacillus sp. SYP-B805]|uniref:HlyD family secretion protein n=1 Tax=Brevibacillus sp. SYP-B805 TaxID=1578199 RepID=UPI0013EAB778|nr:efflux RND transporter periplasmic adaptor subunit [Brevibacillus sp. SYP-B805]NGQ94790.1 HlyD family secretion protein [Brevibacillus sp. SYP-B805]
MKKKIGLLVLVLLVLGGGGYGAKAYIDSTHYVTTDDARIDGELIKVSPEIMGRVTELRVKEGDAVEAGETLARLEEKNTTLQNRDAALVKAPGAGVIIKKFVSVGENVSPGQRLFLLANLQDLYVSARIEETKIERVAVGDLVTIDVDAFPHHPLQGVVEQIGLASDSTYSLLPTTNSSGNFIKVTQRIPIKIRILDQEGLKLLPGMNVVVKIATEG